MWVLCELGSHSHHLLFVNGEGEFVHLEWSSSLKVSHFPEIFKKEIKNLPVEGVALGIAPSGTIAARSFFVFLEAWALCKRVPFFTYYTACHALPFLKEKDAFFVAKDFKERVFLQKYAPQNPHFFSKPEICLDKDILSYKESIFSLENSFNEEKFSFIKRNKSSVCAIEAFLRKKGHVLKEHIPLNIFAIQRSID